MVGQPSGPSISFDVAMQALRDAAIAFWIAGL